MKVCRACSGESREYARRCKHCLEEFQVEDMTELFMPERAITIAAEFAIFGGLLMVLGPFLPFAELGEFAASGLLKTGLSALPVLCAGTIVMVFGVMSIVLRRRYAYWYLPCAAAAAAMTFYHQFAVENQLAYARLHSSDLGLGIHFCYLGALFSLIAAAVTLARRPTVPLRARLEGVASLAETGFRQRPTSMTIEEARKRKRRDRKSER